MRRFEIAAINKRSVSGEAQKRFPDRGYSAKTLRTWKPNVEKARFIRREKGFSIYEVPLQRRH